jgi:hypothetical protein
VLAAGDTLARVCENPKQAKFLSSLTANEGYFVMVVVVGCLQAERVRVIVGGPHASERKPEKQDGVVRGIRRTCAPRGEAGNCLNLLDPAYFNRLLGKR